MANTTVGSVIICDTNGIVATGSVNAQVLLYIPGTGSPTARLLDNNGVALWEVAGSTRTRDQVDIRVTTGFSVDLAGTGTKLYIYTAL